MSECYSVHITTLVTHLLVAFAVLRIGSAYLRDVPEALLASWKERYLTAVACRREGECRFKPF